MKTELSAAVPLRWVGPLKLHGEVNEEIEVPLATFETTLWPSTSRGAKVSRHTAGIQTTIVSENMTRSITLQAGNAAQALSSWQWLEQQTKKLAELVHSFSRYTQFTNSTCQIIGNLLFIRLEFTTGDASGHNMVTKAAEAITHWILQQQPKLTYISLSGNTCTDKKVSAINGLLGRGKYVIAEIIIPAEVCNKILRTTPEKIAEINLKKNLIGSTAAGSLKSANAHFANILLAFFLATGQDAANIVEGSQGITFAEIQQDSLYFSVTLPNLIVGSVGNGKHLPFVQENLMKLGCLEQRASGLNARRLAALIAASVLCGELSLLAALTHPTELMRAHQLFERKEAGVNHD